VILTFAAAALLLAQTALQSFEQAMLALRSHDYATAETHLRAVLRQEPNNIGALGNMGVALTRMRRYVEAAEFYEKALVRSPRDPNLQLNLGITHMQQDRCDLAIPQLTYVMQKQPQNPMLRELVATCQLRQSAADMAIRTLDGVPRTAGVLFILGTAHTRMRRQGQAATAFDQLSKLAPDRSKVLIGRGLYQGGSIKEAIDALEETESWLDLGKAYISAKRADDAERTLRKALAAEPENSEAHYYLGALLVQLQRYNDAAPLLEAAVKTDPDLWGSHYYRGRALLEQKQHAEALIALQKAEQLNPKAAAIYYLLARAYNATGKKKEALRAMSNVKDYRGEALQRELDVIATPR
jgi:predicted Zn-dependent protease